MRTNTTKQKLNNRETVHGCFLNYPDPSLAEFVAMQGWDFVIFDGEHGHVEVADLENLTRAAELRDVTPIARVPTNQPHLMLRYLDRGVQGVHIPWVNSPDQVESAVRSAKYAPRGVRGLAPVRANDYAMTGSLSDYTRLANEETLVVVHMETVEAVAAVEDFIAVDGVDVLFLGPTDLSQSLGYPGLLDHEEVLAAMDRVAEVVVPSDVALGVYAGTDEYAVLWRERGARYICRGIGSFLKDGMVSYLGEIRDGEPTENV